MPKTTHTRKQNAAELMERLQRGPTLHHYDNITGVEAERLVRIWLGSWVIPDVLNLIPELRKSKKGQG